MLTQDAIGAELEKLGLVEWVPAPAWAGHRNYAITEAGREAANVR